MRYLITIAFMYVSLNAFSQSNNSGNKEIYNTHINNINGDVTILKGNITIGTIVINEDANKGKIYITGISQMRDSFNLWHTIIRFKSSDSLPLITAFLTIKFKEPIINVIEGYSGIVEGGLNKEKTEWHVSSNQIVNKSFGVLINSERRPNITITGVLGSKINDPR